MSLIDKLLREGKKALDAALMPLTKDSIKRSIDSAIGNAKTSKVKASLELGTLRLKLAESPDEAESTINKIVAAKETILKAERTIAHLEAELDELFNKKIEESE